MGKTGRRHWIAAAAVVLSLLVALYIVAGCSRQTQTAGDDRTPAVKTASAGQKELSQDERMAWWRDARFGLFIHWGLYAVPAGTYQGERVKGIGEWIMNNAKIPVAEYEKFAGAFNPTGFNADEWVRLAKAAGMRYIVITSKHHDGFCLWDSKVTTWDIMDATPYQRDILKELAAACKKHGIKLCFYHSIMDWHHPDAQAPFYPNYNDTKQSNPNFARYVDTYLKPQLAELLTNYGPLGVLWFDGEWIQDWTEPQGKALYEYVRSLQPQILVNNRVGKGRKGMEGLSKSDEYAGDFGTPEQQVPATGLPGVDWETCMTMNDTWGFKSYDDNWKSTEQLIQTLVDVASKGGNFLLNVGPMPEGLIPQASIERLQAVGKWMAVNSESIYGTTASPFERPAWGRCTAQGNKRYLHVFRWPVDGRLEVPLAGGDAPEKAYLLADKKRAALPMLEGANRVTISLPGQAPDPIDSVVVLVLKK
ncbi:MAG: alpha-L-fucosidase [Planctomycetes bacterium]|nr:alpha-L-fucosidase [Planctomycetota bacterium]